MPYLPGFDLDPKDIRFLGTPIDLIAFKGLNGSLPDNAGALLAVAEPIFGKT